MDADAKSNEPPNNSGETRQRQQQNQQRRSRRLHTYASLSASAEIDLTDELNTLSGGGGGEGEGGNSDDVDKGEQGDDDLDEEDLLSAAIRQAGLLDGSSRGQMLDVDKILAETEYLDAENVPEGFRTGFVTIMGSPNVGKSTLMNSMIGDRLSIVTPKVNLPSFCLAAAWRTSLEHLWKYRVVRRE